MIALRTRILATLMAWLTAVVAVATIAWFAINAAGRQVIADPGVLPLAGERVPAAGDDEIIDVPVSTPRTGQKSTSKSDPKSGRSRPSAGPSSASSDATVTQKNTAGPIAGTYSTEAGRVRVSCDGTQITLTGGYAQPASGWAVEVRDDGPDQVWVRFDQQDRHDRSSLLVMAGCTDGRPKFDQVRFSGDNNRDDNNRDDDNRDDDDRNHEGSGHRNGDRNGDRDRDRGR